MKNNTERMEKVLSLLSDIGVYKNYSGEPKYDRREVIREELKKYPDEMALLIERAKEIL